MSCIMYTIGISFWKCPRRKLYAVTFTDIQECSRGPYRSTKSSSFIDISDSSDDDLNNDEPSKKKRRCDDSKMLQRLNDEVASIRDIMVDMMSLTADTNLPIGLRRILRDTFKCQICHSVPITPPVIVTKCCRNLLGCQACVDTWYSGSEAMNRTCPMCRAERGVNETMVLRGLTEFMEGIRQLFMCGNEDDTGSQAQEESQSD